MMKRKLGTNHMSSSGLTRGSSGVIFHHKNLNSTGCPIGSGMTGVILMMILSFSLPSFAYTSCVGGKIITRNEYGSAPEGVECTSTTCPVHAEGGTAKTFCKSDKQMNWWSAFNWCKSNGGTLASFESMCPGVSTSNVSGVKCAALHKTAGYAGVWSSLGSGTGEVFTVNLSSGDIITFFTFAGRRVNSNYAFCE